MITEHDVYLAGKAIIDEMIDDIVSGTHYSRRHFPGLFSFIVYGPSVELDWLENRPICDDYQITCVSAENGVGCKVHVYPRYRAMLGVKEDRCFEFADPAFPDNVREALQEILDAHEMLRAAERDERNDFILSTRKEGKVFLDITDIPEGRYPNGLAYPH